MITVLKATVVKMPSVLRTIFANARVASLVTHTSGVAAIQILATVTRVVTMLFVKLAWALTTNASVQRGDITSGILMMTRVV